MTTRGGKTNRRPEGKAKVNRKATRARRAKKKERPAATTTRRKIVKRAATVATTARTRAVSARPKTLQARLRRCMRRIVVLEAELSRIRELRAEERKTARTRMARARRQFESRLTRMVQEIGQLRHHEVRARALERKLAAREESAPRTSA